MSCRTTAKEKSRRTSRSVAAPEWPCTVRARFSAFRLAIPALAPMPRPTPPAQIPLIPNLNRRTTRWRSPSRYSRRLTYGDAVALDEFWELTKRTERSLDREQRRHWDGRECDEYNRRPGRSEAVTKLKQEDRVHDRPEHGRGPSDTMGAPPRAAPSPKQILTREQTQTFLTAVRCL